MCKFNINNFQYVLAKKQETFLTENNVGALLKNGQESALYRGGISTEI